MGTSPGTGRAIPSSTKRSSKIDDIVPDKLPAIFLNIHVERVIGLGVYTIEPGRNHLITPHLPAMIVWYVVVAVIFPGSCIFERSHRFTRQQLAGHRPIRAVGIAMRPV